MRTHHHWIDRPGLFARRTVGVLMAAAVFATAACDLDLESTSVLTASLQVAPADVSFSPLYAGVPTTRRVLLTNTGQSLLDLKMALVDPTGPVAFTVRPTTGALRPGETLTVTIGAAAVEGVVSSASATLEVSDVAARTTTLPIFASVRTRPSCDDANPCTVDVFDVDTQSCTHQNELDFVACDDQNACTENTICRAGMCVGDMISCSDDVECTIDTCDPAVGCVFAPEPQRCGDADPCTDDICHPTTGCENPPLAEGAMCASNGCESFGVCQRGACVDYPVPDGATCSDDDRCTVDDTCQQGVCVGGERANLESSAPFAVGPEQVQVDHCAGRGASGNCQFAVYGNPDKILAVAENDLETRVVWQTPFLNVSGDLCHPSAPLGGSYVRPNQEGVTERPGGEDCAATVGLTIVRHGVDVFLANTTTILATVRGPVAASFDSGRQFDLAAIAGPETVVVASADSRLGQLFVDTFTFEGIKLEERTQDYSAHHTMPYESPPELVVVQDLSTVVVVAGTAAVDSCPGCYIFPSANAIQELRVWRFPRAITFDDPNVDGDFDGAGSGDPAPEGGRAPPPPEQEEPPPTDGTPLFLRTAPSGACWTPLAQWWKNPTLLLTNQEHVQLSFTAPTDECGGTLRTYVVEFGPNRDVSQIYVPLPEDDLQRRIFSVSAANDANGVPRTVMTYQDGSIECQSITLPADALPAIACLFVEELVYDDLGPPRVWQIEGAIPQALPLSIEYAPWVLSAADDVIQLFSPTEAPRNVQAVTNEGRRWRTLTDVKGPTVASSVIAGIMEGEIVFNAPPPSTFPVDPDVPGPEEPHDVGGMDVPPDPGQQVGLQRFGCAP